MLKPFGAHVLYHKPYHTATKQSISTFLLWCEHAAHSGAINQFACLAGPCIGARQKNRRQLIQILAARVASCEGCCNRRCILSFSSSEAPTRANRRCEINNHHNNNNNNNHVRTTHGVIFGLSRITEQTAVAAFTKHITRTARTGRCNKKCPSRAVCPCGWCLRPAWCSQCCINLGKKTFVFSNARPLTRHALYKKRDPFKQNMPSFWYTHDTRKLFSLHTVYVLLVHSCI